MDAINHRSEEQLELYSLRRLSEPEVIEIEEHLVLCESCREKVETAAVFAASMREELLNPAPEKLRFGWPAFAMPRFAWPNFAIAGAFAAVLLAVVLYWSGANRAIAPVASLTLTAMRDSSVATADSARQLDITLADAPQAGGPFSVEVVDASGAKVWSGAPAGSAPALLAKVDRRLSPGEYYVRLNGASGQTVHEYRFRIKE